MRLPSMRRFLGATALILSLATGAPAIAAPSAFEAKIAATEQALMADPRAALTLARQAHALAAGVAGERPSLVAAATAKWLEAEALIGLNRIDEAVAPAEMADRLIERASVSTKLAGDIERTLGAIAGTRGDVQQALRRYQTAYRLFTAAGERRSRSIALLDIGQVYWDSGDYARVLQYFDQAAELMPRDDANLKLALHNGRGEVLRSLKRYKDAEKEYASALSAAQQLDSDMLRARILTNLAIAQVMAGRLDAAAASVRRGLALSRGPDAAEWRPLLHGSAARIAERRGDYAGAARELEAGFGAQDLTKTPMSLREMHELAAGVYERLGRRDEALRHLRAFQRLDKEAQALVATNSAQLMAAQFDFTNQNLRIAQLKQGQLERDIRIERQQTRYRTNLFLGLLAASSLIVALLLVGFFSIRRSRNQVRDANTELEQTNGALEKALKAKSDFLATTSHEIRTPLNGILGMTQVLLANNRVDPEVREKIEVVHGAGETMQALVDDLLDVAKMEHGGLTLVSERTDVGRLMADAARLWRAQAEAKGLSLDLSCAAMPAVMTDGARVRQIVFNLLSNAVKFTLAGNVRLGCRLEQGAASVLVIEVADTGIGIAAEHHHTIFEAFSQVDGGTTRQFSGTGLGLSIVRSLVDALAGEITLTSAAGKGATFTVRLPVEPAQTADVVDPAEPRGLALANVLVVDGNISTQTVLRFLLIPQAAAVEVAATGEEAAERLRSGGIDLVLADAGTIAQEAAARLPQLRLLGEAAHACGARFSILQSPDTEPALAALFTLGASQLIAKPIDARALIGAVAALWGEDPPAFVAPALTGYSAAA